VLFPDRAARTFAGPGIGLRTLPANRQTAAMPDAAIAAEIHEALDIHRNFAAQITFDRETRDRIAQARNFGLTQVFDLNGRVDLRLATGFERAGAPDAVDVRQRDRYVFVDGNIDSGDTCHIWFP
jgi:hypothetical protein